MSSAQEIGPEKAPQGFLERVLADGLPEGREVTAVEAERALHEIQELRKVQERVTTWHRKQMEAAEGRIMLYQSLVEHFARQMRRETGSATVELETGTIRTTKRRERVEVHDRAALNLFVETHYPAVQYPDLYLEKVYEKGVKDMVRWERVGAGGGDAQAYDPGTGEVIPGLVKHVPAEGEVSVSIKLRSGLPPSTKES